MADNGEALWRVATRYRFNEAIGDFLVVFQVYD